MYKDQINKINSEREDVAKNTVEIYKIMRYYYKQILPNGQPGRSEQIFS